MLRRCLRVILALIAAAIAATGVFFLIASVMGLFGLDDVHTVVALAHVGLARLPELVAKLVLACGFAAVMLVGVLLLFELLRLRAWIWYGVAAVVVALAGHMLYELLFVRYVPPQVALPALFVPGTRLMTLGVAAALAGSLVYWVVAGRHAGAGRR
jgi:hypothetical protein